MIRKLMLLALVGLFCILSNGSVIHAPYCTYPSGYTCSCDLICETFEGSGGAGEIYTWDTEATATQVSDTGAGGSSAKAAKITGIDGVNEWSITYGANKAVIYFHFFVKIVRPTWGNDERCTFYMIKDVSNNTVFSISFFETGGGFFLAKVNYYVNSLLYVNSTTQWTSGTWYEIYGHYNSAGGTDCIKTYLRPVGGEYEQVLDSDASSGFLVPRTENYGVTYENLTATSIDLYLDRIGSSITEDCENEL